MARHHYTMLAGLAFFAILALWLWEPEPCEPDHEATANWGTWGNDDEPVTARRKRVATYYGDRTTIRPLVSAAYLARIRS